MKVYFVGAGPGDPELLTVKAAHLLKSARCCIWAGSLVHPKILTLLPEGAEVHDSSGMTLEEIVAVMQEASRRGVDVIRLHTGEPALYGAIAEQMDTLDRLGISYEMVPGISAFQAAAATLQIELTVPEVAQAVILARAAGRTPVPEAHKLERLAACRATLCLFLSVGMLAKITRALARHYGSDCPAAVVYHASRPDEKIVRGTLSDIAAKVTKAKIKQTAMVLVGHALVRPLKHASQLYNRAFSHGYRQGSEEG